MDRERTLVLCAVLEHLLHIINLMLFIIEELEYENSIFLSRIPIPCRTSPLCGHEWLIELFVTSHTRRIEEVVCMNPVVFFRLCDDLIANGLKHTQHISGQERVAMFLYITAHGHSNRSVQERFQHSGSTVSTYASKVFVL